MGHQQWKVVVIVPIAIANGPAEENHRMVEEVPIAIGSFSQSREEVSELFRIVAVDFGDFGNVVLIVFMV